MGVPGFFRYILRNQQLKESIVYENINKDIDILYFDFNCLIHPCAAKVRSQNKNWKSLSTLENLIHEEVIAYTEHIIEFVNPIYGIFIGIDGVCPMGKVIQQRERRYKTVIEFEKLNKLKKKFDVEIEKYWCTSKISPCTSFMISLEKKLLAKLKKKYKNRHVWFSTSGTPGEGEHKIIHHIKSLKENKNVAIYGLDADLIFLSLSLRKNNVLLIRESQQVDKNAKNSEFTWVDMDIFKKEIMIKMNSSKENSVVDFIFLCFLVGNDFISKIPTLNIYKNAIPFLIFEYNKNKKNFANKFLVNETTLQINFGFFKEMLHSISVRESFYLQKQYIEYRDRSFPQNQKFENKYKKELYIYERVLDHSDDLQLKGKNILEDKKVYYSRFFNVGRDIQSIIKNYIKTLEWCLHYYFKSVISWDFHYLYHHTPFASDILQFLKSESIESKNKFTLSQPLLPVEQLILIIPLKDKNIIPKSFYKIYEVKEFHKYFNFQKYVTYDNNYVPYRYLTKMILPEIDMIEYKKQISLIMKNLDEKEKKKIEHLTTTKKVHYLLKK